MAESKRTIKNASLIGEYENIFKCPFCSNQMHLVDLKSLICTNRHCFDLAKQGYVNLFTHAIKTKYDKQMFNSRRVICNIGFFDPLIEKISQLILNEIKANGDSVKILDAGCGEGFHLSRIKEKISQSTAIDLLAVGCDISKEGIIIAAKAHPNNIWCVADLNKCPFKDNQFNFILNILSTANYTEFQRMLADDGIIIKVVPDSSYLQELRQIFYEKTDKASYTNNQTVELFKNNLSFVDMQRVQYSVPIDNTTIEHLIHMTPLSWGTTESQWQRALEMNLKEITIDLTILVGKKKGLLQNLL
ncbi:methyltransferase domain-containing protein [Peptococcaceae bacterium 1198_IL3148]